MKAAGIAEKIREVIERCYDLGAVVSIEKTVEGDTNKSFTVVCEQNGVRHKWYVKQYVWTKTKRQIEYEHCFMLYFNDRALGRLQSPKPITNKQGKTWIYEFWSGHWNFYSVFEYMHGLEPYGWVYNEMSTTAFTSCAEAVATFQECAHGFEDLIGQADRPPSLLEEMDQWAADIPKMLSSMQGDRYRKLYFDYLSKYSSFLLDILCKYRASYVLVEDQLPACLTHGDMNQGNMMFDENDRVIGIFDFDWIGVRARMYDVVWLAHEMLCSWNEDNFGHMPVDRTSEYLRIYNNTMLRSGSSLGQLTVQECEFFPDMLQISNIKILQDGMTLLYVDPKENVFKWYINAWRRICLMKLIEKKRDAYVQAALEARI